MIASERMLYIINCLEGKGIINLKATAQELGISEITVRRDFDKLEKEGKLKRVHGGATRAADLEELMIPKSQISESAAHMLEKTLVAQRAANVVREGDCVFLDAGNSMVPLLDILANKKIKIVTYNDLLVRRISNPVAELFIVGGQFLPYYSMSVGSIAQDVLRQFHFDVAFLGCSGVDLEHGIAYITEVESLMMKRIALQNSTKSCLLIDSSKLKLGGFFKLTETANFNTVFCNRCETIFPVPENFVII